MVRDPTITQALRQLAGEGLVQATVSTKNSGMRKGRRKLKGQDQPEPLEEP
jgi:Mn-dependent DtxR family transcriptional regulator